MHQLQCASKHVSSLPVVIKKQNHLPPGFCELKELWKATLGNFKAISGESKTSEGHGILFAFDDQQGTIFHLLIQVVHDILQSGDHFAQLFRPESFLSSQPSQVVTRG